MSNVVSIKHGLPIDNLVDANLYIHMEQITEAVDSGEIVQMAAVLLRRDGSVETFIPTGTDRFAMFGAIHKLARRFGQEHIDI